MHHKGTVYLAGPIANVPGIQACDWRDYAEDQLKIAYQCSVRNPMRVKDVKMRDVALISSDFHTYQDWGIFFTSRAIMTRDFNDVKTSDVLLVNLLGALKPSLGTIMELAWAFALQKPCVVVIETTGNPHDNHPMIAEAMSFRVDNLDDAIHATSVILGGH